MKSLLIVLAFAFVAIALTTEQQEDFALRQQFGAWKKQHNRIYANDAEHELRFTNYKASLKRIAHRNLMNPKAHFALNKFSDMSVEEFRAAYLMKKMPADAAVQSCLAQGVDLDMQRKALQSAKALPTSFDWRQQGKVSKVKDQAQCGSCWTFSTTGVIESAYAIKNNVNATLLLSEQAIVDCSHACSNVDGQSVCNQGCDGGWPWAAVSDVISWKGLPTEKDYPYQGVDGTCQMSGMKLNAPPSNFSCLSGPNQQGGPADEANLMPTVLINNGPLSIALNADPFQDYDSGIIDPYFPSEECDPTQLDHAVLIVGYGVEHSAIWGDTPYWIIKNSWSTSWGENGYVRLFRGEGLCGVNAAVMTVTM